MLLQSHEGFINILPALPDEWKDGSLKGFKVRGGATVDLDWADGRPTEMVIILGWSGAQTVRIPDGMSVAVNGKHMDTRDGYLVLPPRHTKTWKLDFD